MRYVLWATLVVSSASASLKAQRSEPAGLITAAQKARRRSRRVARDRRPVRVLRRRLVHQRVDLQISHEHVAEPLVDRV